MLGDTLTITLGGSGGAARVCSKINQDAFSAEYLNRLTTDEIRVKVRHTKESAKSGELYPLERHNVLVTQRVFATPTTTEKFREVSFTIRARPDDLVADVTNVGKAQAFYLTGTILDKLYAWES